jgi:DNA primase
LRTFLHKHKVSEEEAYTAGLLSKNQKGTFDMFRGRLMFPLHDHRGQIIGFAGRLLDKEAKMAKYINTPETPLYIKGNTLYGLYQATAAIKEAKSVILVEGELDVLSSVQAGVRHVVAVKGTALTPNQLSLIRRFAQTLILALDQDSAGQAATRRSIELALEAGFTVRIATLPYGKDVDDLAKQSPKSWQNVAKEARPYYEWLVDTILTKYDLKDPFAKNQATQELLPFLQTIDNEIIREHYYRLLAKKLEVSFETLVRFQRKLNYTRKNRTQPVPDEPKKPKEVALLAYLESLLLQTNTVNQFLPKLMEQIPLTAITVSAEKQLWELLLQEPTPFNQEKFLKNAPQALSQLLDTLFLTEVLHKSFKSGLTFSIAVPPNRNTSPCFLICRR